MRMKPEKKAEKKATNVKEKSKKVSKKKGNSTLIIGVVAVILLAGIGYAVLSGGSGSSQNSTATNQLKLPSFAYKDAMTLKGYTYATQHPDILEQIPCYCGCGGHGSVASEGKPHRFLRDCYINDNWQYDDHASNCDTCLAIASKVQDYLAAGKTLKEARTLIDQEYQGKYPDSMATNTAPVSDNYIPILKPKTSGLSETVATPAKVDLSGYSLPGNFNSLADGLNLTPAGANRAYFINTKMIAGTEMENALLGNRVQPDSFYNKTIIGMYSADFNPSSWIEMHDLGYDNTKDATLKAHIEQGMKNIVYTRPLVYGHSQNVDNVLKLMSNPNSMQTSYQTYKPLLDAVDYKNAAYAEIIKEPTKFSDISYTSWTPVNGKVELVKAFNVTDDKSAPAALDKYTPQKGKVLVIKLTGDLTTVQKESDNIDTIART
jgi:hypothetical protein